LGQIYEVAEYMNGSVRLGELCRIWYSADQFREVTYADVASKRIDVATKRILNKLKPPPEPEPQFDVGDKVTPIALYVGEAATLTPGVAYKVNAYSNFAEGGRLQIRLEGCYEFFDARMFRKYKAPAIGGVYSDHLDAYGLATGTAWAKHIPFLPPGNEIHLNKESPMSIIPPLEIPTAPQPEPLRPESASVQMLRKLVEARRTDLQIAIDKKAWREKELAVVEDRANQLRSKIDDDNAKICAADAAIAEALADIEKLGGRPEEVVS